MAFDADGFVAAAHGAGTNKIHYYTSPDLITAIDDADYFLSVYDQLTAGDLILVASDNDNTKVPSMLQVSASSSTTVTTVALASATINLVQPLTAVVNVPAIGTAETVYYHPAITSGYTGEVTRVSGVSDTSGLGSGGTSTITVSVPTTGAIATLAFDQDYTAGTKVEDASITAHAAITTDGVITIATDGAGSHTGAANVTIEITLTVV